MKESLRLVVENWGLERAKLRGQLVAACENAAIDTAEARARGRERIVNFVKRNMLPRQP